MDKPQIAEWAERLDQALLGAREVDRITQAVPELSNADAYLIQAEGIRLREKRGEVRIGLKMGLTSRAKREQMGLHSPVYGVLTDRMKVTQGAFSLVHSIHPKIEPEIAFLIDRELKGPVSREEALSACAGVAAAMEILDSRYVGFKYFSLPDVIADNSSSAYFVLGPVKRDFSRLALDRLNMAMSVNGMLAQSALSAEISGDPVLSIVQLCELLAVEGRTLPKGSVVLAGAATTAVALEPGHRIRLDVDGLEAIELNILLG